MIDAETIKQLQQADSLLAIRTAMSVATREHPEVPLPPGFSLQSVTQHYPTRLRQKGKMSTSVIDSFVAYCTDTDTKEAPACFIDADKMAATTVFNYGNNVAPGHADYTAALTLKATAEYKAVMEAVRVQRYTQRDLAHFLEEMDAIVVPIDENGTAYSLNTAISAIRKVEVNAQLSNTHEAGDMKAARSSLERVEARASGLLVLPSILLFKFAPYVGLTERPFRVRVIAHLDDSPPTFGLRFIGHELIVQEMANEFVDLLKLKLSVVVPSIYIGSYTP